MPCQVCISVDEMGPLLQLRQLPTHYLLVGGKVEKELKYFLGAAWQAADRLHRAYVMDKNFPRQLDLLALENREPRFWVETKCSFRQDKANSLAAAHRACVQVMEIMEAPLDAHLNGAPAYVVHFLNSTPGPHDALLPRWVLRRYAVLGGDVQPQNLEAIYTAAGHRSHGVTRISKDPIVDAIIIEIVHRRQNVRVNCDKAKARARVLRKGSAR